MREALLMLGVSDGNERGRRDLRMRFDPREGAVELLAVVEVGTEDYLRMDLDSRLDELLEDLYAAIRMLSSCRGP